MLFKNVLLLNENFEIEPNRYIGVKDSRIMYVGSEMPQDDFGEIYDGSGKLLTPAFYNSHAHTPMTLMRGYGENMALQDWLNQKIFPFESHLTADSVYYGALLGIAEMFRSGTVATTDMYMQAEALLKAFIESGAKTNYSTGTLCFDDRSFYELEDYPANEMLFSEYHMAEDGRIRIDMSLHAEYTSSPKVVTGVAEYAKTKNCRMHLHLSETKAEHEASLERHGKTPAAYFNELGIFDLPTTAAHCVWVDENDMAIMAEKGVSVGHCPVSNLKLASGIAPVPKFFEKGINVALGTDSVASNNNLSMIQEMNVFALIHKGSSNDPTVITPAQTLAAATVNSAKAQGRDDCGVIKPGMRADLIVIDLKEPHWQPATHLVNHLVYAAEGSDVCLTMSDGRIVYRDGEFPTIDLEKVVYEVESHYKIIVEQL